LNGYARSEEYFSGVLYGRGNGIGDIIRMYFSPGEHPPPHFHVYYNEAEMNAFHIEGRYPETLTKPPTVEEAVRYMKRAEEVFRWLTELL
jgi:HEPN domain-containing protein